jgi:WD40 repeat protein
VFGCAFSPDGQHIVSASGDDTLKVWDVQSGQEHLTLKGHTNAVSGCAFSPDGRSIVSSSRDHTLKVWDAQSGQCLTTLVVEGLLYDCAWSPDGQQLVAVGAGGVYFLEIVW